MKTLIANTSAFSLALALSLYLAAAGDSQSFKQSQYIQQTSKVIYIKDARKNNTAASKYQRIVSLHLVATQILPLLISGKRIVGVSADSKTHPMSHLYEDAKAVPRAEQLEVIFNLKPELVIVSHFFKEAQAEKIRNAGIKVFDLGPMLGTKTTLQNIETLGKLLFAENKAKRLRKKWSMEIKGLTTEAQTRGYKPGIYLSIYGQSLYGGTKGSSYEDLLFLAGIDDIAKKAGYKQWPAYRPEEVLTLQARLVITQRGMAKQLCTHPLVGQIPACKTNGTIIELQGKSHADSGLGLTHTAAFLQEQLVK